MNITVFGGAGFLGSHVCDKLMEAGHQVTIFDRIPSPWLKAEQRMFLGDVLHEEKVMEAVKDAHIVFNFAGIADMEDARNLPIETVKYNVLGNTIILEACRLAGVQRYVFASSAYVYSKSGGFYRCSKQACELYIENYHQHYGLDYTILRYGSLYGPRSDQHNGVYRFLHQALTENKIIYGGKPESLREYIHVEDAAQASVEILKPTFINQHIILTGHQAITVENMFKMIKEILGKTIEFEFRKHENNDHYDITPYSFNPKIGKKLTSTLHIDLGQGILKMIEELHQSLHPELHNMQGYLVEENTQSLLKTNS